MSALATVAAALAGKELFKKVVLDLYEYCHTQTGQLLKRWATERQIDTLYRRIAQVRKVKTIWQVDKAVDLAGFYCDSHIVIAGKRKKIAQLSDFPLTDNLLIQGIAGQGKSIFLRYLCSVELGRGEHIPLFLELRRITHETSLMDRIRNSLLALGLSVDDQLFHCLASSGKILLFLDAFDEVPDDLKSKVLTDIEDLAARHQALRIIVTSRPYHNIQVSNHFTVVALDNLQGREYSQVIRKLASGQAWAQGLIDHIEKKAHHIKDLLCTPLMVTLLVLSYKSYQQLPAKLSDFYESLFQTLLQRHDGTKPGFTRQRGCTLDDDDYREAFEALCILAKKRGHQSFDVRAMAEITKDAIAQCAFKASPAPFVDDIVKITCLIIRDGEEHRFIHKTVQEYYTASYIQKRPQAWARDFYSRVLKTNAYREWKQELDFLSEIDTYRYNRFFYLPALLGFLKMTEDDLGKMPAPVDTATLAACLETAFLSYSPEGSNQYSIRIAWTGKMGFLHQALMHAILYGLTSQQLLKEASEVPESCSQLPEDVLKMFPSARRGDRHERILSLGAAILAGKMPTIVSKGQREFARLIENAKRLNASLRVEENVSLLDGLV